MAEMDLFYPGCQRDFFVSEAAIVSDEAAIEIVSERNF